MPTLGFAAALRNFEVRTTDKMNDVLQGATREIFDIETAPGHMRGSERRRGTIIVWTQKLDSSFVLSIDESVVARGSRVAVAVYAQQFKTGSVLVGVWTADHALRNEYGWRAGTKHIPGTFWVTTAAEKWQSAVASHAGRVG